ncbi:uncharacterized protein LOC144433640 [Glandiceps talaboti]
MDSDKTRNTKVDFTLNASSGDSGFQNRSKDVFGQLGALEDSYQKDVTHRGDDTAFIRDEDEEEDLPSQSQHCDVNKGSDFKRPSQSQHCDVNKGSDFKRPSQSQHCDVNKGSDFKRPSQSQHCDVNKGSDFKRPWQPAKRRRDNRGVHHKKAPDYVVHPQSWVKYSLSETGEEGIGLGGDDLNRKIALDFLKGRKKKSDESLRGDEEKVDGEIKITFRKPELKHSPEIKKEKGRSGNGTILPFVDHIHRMPEYVVGRDKTKDLKKKTSATATQATTSSVSSNLQLEHLDEASKSEDSIMSHGKKLSHDQSESHLKVTKEAVTSNQPLDQQDTNFKSFKGKGNRKIRKRAREDEDVDW